MRRALFGQSTVDFSADPWIGHKDRNDSKRKEVSLKPRKAPTRIEREFSQSQSEASQTQTQPESRDDSSEEVEDTPMQAVSVEVFPEGTVYFSDGFSSFQDFSGFQYQEFQMNNNQFSAEPFQEQAFQTGF